MYALDLHYIVDSKTFTSRQEKQYSKDTFYRIMINTRASVKSTIGYD
jgi:hypothetical protein